MKKINEQTQTTIRAIEATNGSLGAKVLTAFLLLNMIDAEEDRRTQ